MTVSTSRKPYTLLGDQDLHLFNEGTHRRLAERLGSHPKGKRGGFYFAVWAPDAEAVAVVGDFNDWDPAAAPLQPRASSGIWEGVVPKAKKGQVYKYAITARDGRQLEKADPFAARAEEPPRTGSVLWDLDYEWGDDDWMSTRGPKNALDAPISIYEVHL